MRVYGHNRPQGPSWIVAVAIFAGLLLLLQLFGGRVRSGRPLEQQFAASRPAAGAGRLVLPPLPAGAAGLARTAAARISGGATGAALTPVAQGAELRVEITGLRQTPHGLRITGSATNIGGRPLPVTLAAFRFTDGTGTVYAPENAAATTLNPGQRALLDLTLPIQNARELTLEIQLEGEPPLHMVLIQAPLE